MTNREFEAYLSLLVRLMPIDQAECEAIRDELRSHLEDRYDELVTQKVSRDEAFRRAVDEFGDAAQLASAFVSLSRTQRRRRIMRFSSATLVAAALTLVALTAFWPTDPAGGPAVVGQPLAPSIAQAQIEAPPKEQRRTRKSEIRQKLEQPIDIEFSDVPLLDVLDYLADSLRVQFHVNRKALADAGATVESPVSISLKQVKAETVLDLILENGDANLDFVERDGFILVSTVEDLDRLTEVRIYNCRDLLSLVPPGDQGAAAMSGGGFGAPAIPMGMEGASGGGLGGLGGVPLMPESPRQRLMGLLMDSVESDSWVEFGGEGSISEFNGLLVVKQSARIHEKIADLLEMLRKAAEIDNPQG